MIFEKGAGFARPSFPNNTESISPGFKFKNYFLTITVNRKDGKHVFSAFSVFKSNTANSHALKLYFVNIVSPSFALINS